jgi:hypothetical protein
MAVLESVFTSAAAWSFPSRRPPRLPSQSEVWSIHCRTSLLILRIENADCFFMPSATMSKLKPSGAVGAYMVYARRSGPPIYEAQAYHDNSAQLRDVTSLGCPRAQIPLEDPTSTDPTPN